MIDKPQIDYLRRPFSTPAAPVLSLMAGKGAKVTAALNDIGDAVYIAHHGPHEALKLSLGMDPRDNRAALEEASRTLGPPTWVALLEGNEAAHRQGLLALVHQRLAVVGVPVIGAVPALPPFALLSYAGLRAFAAATLVALTQLHFLPRSLSPVALLTGLDTTRILEPWQDHATDDTIWRLGGEDEVQAIRTTGGWALLAGSRISNRTRFAQEPHRCAQILEDIFTGVAAEERSHAIVQVPLLFSSLEEIEHYAVGSSVPSKPWTRSKA